MTPPSSHTSRTIRRNARAEAAAWVVRLSGSHRTPELEAGFRRWLAADVENGRQFERVTEVWDTARNVPVGGITRLIRWNPSGFGTTWARVAAVAILGVSAALVSYRIWLGDTYRTAVGEQRLVPLEDGTRVSLNSDTRMSVRMTAARRHVTLTSGEAYFEVKHDPARPFVVSAGTHDVTAIGTSFVVRYGPDGTAVTLVEGKVTVSNANSASVTQAQKAGPPTSRETLKPGERLVLARNTPPRLDFPRIDAVTAWRHGEVVLDRTTLAEAVAEMNRYEDEKLMIDSPEIARLGISGIYHTGDSKGFAESVAKLYH